VENNFRFPRQYYDQETGLHYNYFRDYNPGIGRYIEPDPIGLMGGINVYAYCMNDPINMADPSGQVGIPGIIIGAASGGLAGFVAGAQAGNIWAGVVGGAGGALIGGFVGGVGGFAFSPEVGAIVGGIAGGLIGGASGGVIAKKLEDPYASTAEKLQATAKGAGIGIATGTIAGALGVTATSIGATGYAISLASAVITTPIACVLGIFSDLFIGRNSEGDISSTIPFSYGFGYVPPDPPTIDRNTSKTISVIGGIPPYTWSVSGTGFNLEETETQGLSNALIADDTACGTAKITVTDASGKTTIFKVRCTAGYWRCIEGICHGYDVACCGEVDYQACYWSRCYCQMYSWYPCFTCTTNVWKCGPSPCTPDPGWCSGGCSLNASYGWCSKDVLGIREWVCY